MTAPSTPPSTPPSGPPPRPEFSRPFALAQLGEVAVPFDLTAEPAECAALARRFRIPAVKRLRGHGTVQRARAGELILVEGEIEGAVTQTCVVTLEPVDNDVAEPFRIAFLVDPQIVDGEVVIDPEDPEEPEPLEEDPLDLGELIAQHFSLALDPYPRRPDVSFTLAGESGDGQDKASPFAALKALKPKP